MQLRTKNRSRTVENEDENVRARRPCRDGDRVATRKYVKGLQVDRKDDGADEADVDVDVDVAGITRCDL